MKAFVISQPKAGTYLLSSFLYHIGMNQSYMHISERVYYQFDPEHIELARTNPELYQRAQPYYESIKQIPKNGFAVGHLPYQNNFELVLRDVKKILLTRDHNEIAESYRRWSNESGRGFIEEKFNRMLSKLDPIREWKGYDVFAITFQDLIDKNIDKLDQLQLFLYNKINVSSSIAIEKALNYDTKTKSSLRS